MKIYTFLLITLFALQCSPNTDKAQQSNAMNNWVNIFGTEQWYKEQSNEEVNLKGSLHKLEMESGPAGRSAATFAFKSSDQKMNLKVYAPRKQSELAQFTDKEIALIGKIIDLESEGFSKELWINKIRVLKEE